MEVNSDVGYTHVTNEARIIEGQDFKKDLPFDLNNLFNMQYSFDQLKIAIEYLAKQQCDQQALLDELLTRDPNQMPFEVLDRQDKDLGRAASKQSHRSAKSGKSGKGGAGAGNGDKADKANSGNGKGDGKGDNANANADDGAGKSGDGKGEDKTIIMKVPSGGVPQKVFDAMKEDFEKRIHALEILTQRHSIKHEQGKSNLVFYSEDFCSI